MTNPVDPISTAIAVARILDGLGILHTIGGSIAASVAGEPRSTVDVDFVAAIDETQVPALVEAFSPDFYIDADSLRRAIRTRGTTNLIEQATQVKVDLFIAGGTPLDEQQLNRRQTVSLADGRTGASTRGHCSSKASMVQRRRRDVRSAVARHRFDRESPRTTAGPRVS